VGKSASRSPPEKEFSQWAGDEQILLINRRKKNALSVRVQILGWKVEIGGSLIVRSHRLQEEELAQRTKGRHALQRESAASIAEGYARGIIIQIKKRRTCDATEES